MSERPTAFYDDLGVAPDADFDRELRRHLDAELRSVRVQQFTLPGDVEIDVALLPDPEPEVREQRRRSGRSILTVAAAIAASVAVGVVVDRLVADDATDPPVATVPSVTSAPVTIAAPSAPTTTEP